MRVRLRWAAAQRRTLFHGHSGWISIQRDEATRGRLRGVWRSGVRKSHVAGILKFYAKLNDGAFPERIDGPELVAKITLRAGEKRIEDPEFMKEFTTLAGSLGMTWTFRQTLNKFGYLGTAHLNDADSIVFWYLPKDAETYRVVFADLTIGDVTEAKLPKVPMK